MNFLPLVLAVLLVLGAFFLFTNFSLDRLADYAADDLIFGILVILFLFAVKSFTVIIPVHILYIAVGSVFPMPLALLINLAGLSLELSLPYFLGRLAGKDLYHKLVTKYPKAQKFAERVGDKGFFRIYLVRLIGLFSMDLTSMVMGCVAHLSYKSYLLASLLDSLPTLLIITYLGANVTDPYSMEFIIAIILTLLLAVFSLILYKKHNAQEDADV